ncbi:MAG TPA: SDR family oxidoreductase [Burkholderiales bacterium]|nr:SDR family oxidoreductase [Burkholderiales bacterium]
MNGRFLEGKVAVVTGASRGLGRAMALALGAAGASLALVGRDKVKLAETQGLAKEKGARAEVFITDVREESQIKRLEQEVSARLGKAHILINNAGTAVRKNVADFTLEEWRTVVDTNLTGAFLMSRAFIPHMKTHKWGRIINVTSIMAHVGSAGRGAYCSSKSGLLALTRCMALELVGDGINVVAISPGFYATDLTAPLRADPQKNAALMAATPMARWGKPEEIGQLALFICSEAAAFMTGNDILTDGGWTAQ